MTNSFVIVANMVNNIICHSNLRRKFVKVSEFIYIDVCGPMSETSIGGSKYFLLFKDDKSSFRHTYFLKYKNEVINKFKEFEQLLGVQLCFRRLPIDGFSGK